MMSNKYNESENICCTLFSTSTQNYFITIFYDFENYTKKLLKICIPLHLNN